MVAVLLLPCSQKEAFYLILLVFQDGGESRDREKRGEGVITNSTEAKLLF